MKHFGEELKFARESRGISLQEISKETRINQKFIEEMENGNFNLLPQTYVRAFIRAYAKYIGLNPTETIKRYEQYVGGKYSEEKTKIAKPSKPEPSKSEPEEEKSEPITFQDHSIKKIEEYLSQIKTGKETEEKKHTDEEPKPKKQIIHTKSRINYSALFLIITALVIILIFVLLNLPEKKDNEPERLPFEKAIQETEQKYSQKEDTLIKKDSSKIFIMSDSLTLGIISDIDVWVNVRMDKDRNEKGLLTANTKKYYRAKKKFTVVASKGRKIKIFLDEKFLGNLSQTDSLSGATITPEGLKSFKIQKKPVIPQPELKMMELKPLENKLP